MDDLSALAAALEEAEGTHAPRETRDHVDADAYAESADDDEEEEGEGNQASPADAPRRGDKATPGENAEHGEDGDDEENEDDEDEHRGLESALRKYQRKLLRKVERGMQKGEHTLVYLPTGGGKTMLAGHLLRRFVRARSIDASHALFVVNRNALVDQTARAMEACGLAKHEFGFIKAGYKRTPNLPLQIASIQTLFSKTQLREPDEALRSIRLLVVDEAHCMLADQYLQLTTRFADAVIVGLTATPFRMREDEALCEVFPRLARGPSVSKMIRKGYLVPPVFMSPSTAPGRKLSGKVAQMDETLDAALQRWTACCKDTLTIVFCATVKQSKMCVSKFLDAGVAAEHLDGSISEKHRRRVFALAESGELRVLSSVGVLSEGFDLPCIETVILLRPTDSRGLYVQQVGRGLRPFPGKTRCVVLDEVGNIYRHGPVDGPLGFEWERLPGAEGSDAKAKRRAEALTQRLVRSCKTPACAALLHREERHQHCLLCQEKEKRRADVADAHTTRVNVGADELADLLSSGLRVGSPAAASADVKTKAKADTKAETTGERKARAKPRFDAKARPRADAKAEPRADARLGKTNPPSENERHQQSAEPPKVLRAHKRPSVLRKAAKSTAKPVS